MPGPWLEPEVPSPTRGNARQRHASPAGDLWDGRFPGEMVPVFTQGPRAVGLLAYPAVYLTAPVAGLESPRAPLLQCSAHVSLNENPIPVAVVVAFFICWAPFHAQRLLAVYASPDSQRHDAIRALYNALTYMSGVLYYLSTTVNPVLYHIMSNKFREAFKVRSTGVRYRSDGK